MIYILLRVAMWWCVFLISHFIFTITTSEPTYLQDYVYPAIVATVVIYGIPVLTRIRQLIRRFNARLRTNVWMEQTREIDPDKRISLLDLRLVIESGKTFSPIRKLGMLVNPQTDFAVRPYMIIKVNDKSLIGRSVTFRFWIVDPDRYARYNTPISVTLKLGENRIVPRNAFNLPRRTTEGEWYIHVLIGNRLWKVKKFLMTKVTLERMAGNLDGDMELSYPVERDAEGLTGLNPQDELKDILE